MNTQLTLFDQYTVPQINTAPPARCKVIQFPGISTAEPPKKVNYRKGEEQTVFPIKSREQLDAMASWLRANADPKYLLSFILGINLGLRANELLALKQSDIFFPDGKVRCIVGDYTDTTDKISVFQKKVDKRRGLYLNKSCVRIIQWYFKGQNMAGCKEVYLFRSRELRPLYDDDGNMIEENIRDCEGNCHIEVGTLRKMLKRAAKACGIKQNIGTHTLRKTFGYFHYQKNHDIVFLQRLFGHSSALITMRYIGIADEEEKKAYHDVSIDLLGDILGDI